MRPTRRATPAVLAVLALALGLLAGAPATGAGTPVRGSLTTTSGPTVTGETVVFRAKLPATVARPYRLQKSVAGAWKNVGWATAERTGAATFARPTGSSAATFRALAPAHRAAGRTWPALRTPSVVVTPVVPACAVAIPSSAEGDPASATVTVQPPRVRPATVERRTLDDTWVAVATTTTDGAGSGTTSFTPDDSGTYRVTLPASAGLPACTSGPTDHTVTTAAAPAPVQISLVTDGGGDPIDREVYSRGTLTVDDGSAPPASYPTRVRVRGNSTSMAWVKLSYKIKLDTKASVLGMPKSKDWALLANFYDRSMVRTDVAMEAARRIGMPWALRMRFAELTVNGRYRGLYQYAETPTADKGRADVGTGGHLIQGDSADDTDPGFRTGRGFQVFLKDPDSPDGLPAVSARVRQIEDALYADGFDDPVTGYASYLDVDSFVDWYLLNELTKNIDAGFQNSIWMVLRPDGRLAMGPPWDFDQSLGNKTVYTLDDPAGLWVGRNLSTHPAPNQWYPLTQFSSEPHGHWLNRLLEDPAFRARVRERWQEVAPALGRLPRYVTTVGTATATASERNFAPLAEGGAGLPLGESVLDPATVTRYFPTWGENVVHVHDWTTRRIAWLDQEWG